VESFRVVDTGTIRTPAKDMQYLSSQYLADSSLSQDVSQSTFFKATTSVTPVNITASNSTAASAEEIELDEYNSNHCMMTVLQVLDHLQSKFGVTYDKQEMPKWMFELHTKFTTASSPNVLLFILKVIINRPEVFLPYSNYWVKPILRNVASGIVGDKFNYFLRDICILLLKWNVIPKETSEEKQLYSQFMVKIFAYIFPNVNFRIIL
jgi:DNA-dependent protein kinase catalytic subunit